MVLMFASTALMVSVLFSAIVTERRSELGLLKAIGARRGQMLGMHGDRGGAGDRRRRHFGRRAGRAGDAPVRALAGLLPRECRRAVPLGRPAAHDRLRRGCDRAGLASSARWACSIRRGGRAGATPTTSCAAGAEPCCRAAALRKSYVTERGEVVAVAGIDLEVEAGRYAAIIGRSGSGKSSLMAMIGGLSRPSDGTVHGRRHRHLGPVGRRAGGLPQRPHRLRLPVREPAADPAR